MKKKQHFQPIAQNISVVSAFYYTDVQLTVTGTFSGESQHRYP